MLLLHSLGPGRVCGADGTHAAQKFHFIHLNEVKKLLKNSKKLAKMIGHIFEMSDEDPHKEEIRKYSAIYGRFDFKRKDGKHLTLHELTGNEAAPQLCVKDNALLTREELSFLPWPGRFLEKSPTDTLPGPPG